jgi:hypothetical protein
MDDLTCTLLGLIYHDRFTKMSGAIQKSSRRNPEKERLDERALLSCSTTESRSRYARVTPALQPKRDNSCAHQDMLRFAILSMSPRDSFHSIILKKSRSVKMPTSFPFLTTGIAPMSFSRMTFAALPTSASGSIVVTFFDAISSAGVSNT